MGEKGMIQKTAKIKVLLEELKLIDTCNTPTKISRGLMVKTLLVSHIVTKVMHVKHMPSYGLFVK